MIGTEGIKKSRKLKLPETSMIVVELLKTFPTPWMSTVFVDNFFSSTKLFTYLKTIGFAACGTSKAGSGINIDQVALKIVSTKKDNWGLQTITTSPDDQVLNMSWQDNNTVLLLTTAHEVQDCFIGIPRNAKNRKDIPEESVEDFDGERWIVFPRPTNDYNKHMGGSDGNQQQRQYYSTPHHTDRRYWWVLFMFILHAAVLNAYLLYKVDFPESKMTHSEFQREIALHLLRNPVGNTHRGLYSFTNDNPSVPRPAHRWTELPKRQTCDPCRRAGRKRKALGDITNTANKKRRPPQTQYGCIHEACKGLAACKPGCWNEFHSVDFAAHRGLDGAPRDSGAKLSH